MYGRILRNLLYGACNEIGECRKVGSILIGNIGPLCHTLSDCLHRPNQLIRTRTVAPGCVTCGDKDLRALCGKGVIDYRLLSDGMAEFDNRLYKTMHRLCKRTDAKTSLLI